MSRNGPPWASLVPAGWTPAAWALRLRQMADACRPGHPDISQEYESWAEQVERVAPRPPVISDATLRIIAADVPSWTETPTRPTTSPSRRRVQ